LQNWDCRWRLSPLPCLSRSHHRHPPLEGNQVQGLQPAAVPEQVSPQAPQPLEGNQIQGLLARDDDGADDPVFVPLQQHAQNPVLVGGNEVVLADKPIEI
jgi:hypothetical protein